MTRKCSDGRVCNKTALVSDDQDVCESCLLYRFGLFDCGVNDSADEWGLVELFPRDKVVEALRRAVANEGGTA